jgi:hypothetical protein
MLMFNSVHITVIYTKIDNMTIHDLNEEQLIKIGRLALGLPKDIILLYGERKSEKGIWENGKQLTNDILRVWFTTPENEESIYWKEEKIWVMTIVENLDVIVEYPIETSLYTFAVRGQREIQNTFQTLGL